MVSLVQRLSSPNVSRSSTTKPPRAPPKAYRLLLKTHKLTIFVTAHQFTTVTELKEEALSALTCAVLSSSSSVPHIPTAPGEDVEMMDEEEEAAEVPCVESVEVFELCRAVKDKRRSNTASSLSAYIRDLESIDADKRTTQ